MLWVVLGVVIVSVQAPPPAADAPRGVVEKALQAVEAGTGPEALAAASRQAASRAPLDRLRLGALRVLLFQDDAAEPDLRALALADSSPVALQAALQLAASYQRRGQVAAARGILDRAAALAAAAGDTTAIIEVELSLAAFDLRSGAPGRAAERIAKAEGLTPPADLGSRARVHCQRAALLSFSGRPGGELEAERGAGLALEANRRRLAGQCLLTAGTSLIQRGEINAGADVLQRAAPVLRATRDDAALAAVLQWTGYGYRTLLRFREAYDALREALVLADRSGAASARAWARLNLASISAGLEDFEAARDQLGLAVSDFERQDDQWGRHSALTLRSAMLRRLGALDSAEVAAREVLSWGQRTGAPASVSGALFELTWIAAARKEWPVVAERIDSLDALYQRSGWTVWRSALRYERAVVALAVGDLTSARALLEQTLRGLVANQPLPRYRARVRLAEVEARSGRLDKAATELAFAGNEVDAARRSLPFAQWRQLVLQATSSADPDLAVATIIATLAPTMPAVAFDLAEGRRARELRDRQLRISTLASAADSVPAAPLPAGSLADFQAALHEAEAAGLVYVTGQGDEPTTMFVVSPDSVRVALLPPIDSLAPSIGRLAAALESGAGAESIRRELYGILVSPAEARLGSLPRRLVIVPEGPLYRVPFAALLDGGDRPLLARTVPVVVPSASMLSELRGRPAGSSTRGVLALADPPAHARVTGPAGAPELDALFAARGATGPLPGARREARRVVRFADQSRLLVGSRATEAALLAADPGSYRVLHFASHALIDGGSPLRAAIALAPDPGNDAFLTAGEIAGLELNADLVVLSTCRSAGGAVLAGEGLQGLTWPLLSAGARSVVASMWDVEDQTTSALMTQFYAEMAGGLAVVDALGAAQRRAMERGDPAASWAAFTVIGDPLARPPLREPSGRGWWWLGLVLATAALWLGISWGRRRRRSR